MTNSDAERLTTGTGVTGYASNFQCNPSSIDGLTVTNSSQGGGGTQNVTIPGLALGTHLPYCYGTNVYVLNNYVRNNSSIGDEIFSGTPAGARGVTFCIGTDYYKFQ